MEGSMMTLEDRRQNDDDLLTTISIVIIDLLVVNKNCGAKDNSYFTAVMPRASDVLDFVSKIKKYSKCSDSCFVVGLIYVDRVVNMHDFVLTPQNVYLVYLTAVMVAAKFHEDIFYNNAFYAQLGEITLKEINATEVQLLSLLQFSLVVNGDLYDKYSRELCEYRARVKALASQQQQQQQHQAMMSMGMFTPLIPIVIPQALATEQLDSPVLSVHTPTAHRVMYDFAAPVSGMPVAYGHAQTHAHALVYPVSPGPPPPPGLEHRHRVPLPVPVYQTLVPTNTVNVLPMQVVPATVTPVLGSYANTPGDFGEFASSPVHLSKSAFPTAVIPKAPLLAFEQQPYF